MPNQSFLPQSFCSQILNSLLCGIFFYSASQSYSLVLFSKSKWHIFFKQSCAEEGHTKSVLIRFTLEAEVFSSLVLSSLPQALVCYLKQFSLSSRWQCNTQQHWCWQDMLLIAGFEQCMWYKKYKEKACKRLF